ncbi:chitinase [Leucobacter sp. W1478]|uniref:chitinase n=1 Tax=Leucobacter sp. W1478 TaxID=3439065 RepID=UPI003F3C5825
MTKWFPGRRLSWFRLFVAVVVVSGLAFSGFQGWFWWHDAREASVREAWFDGYVDITATPTFDFAHTTPDVAGNIVMAFVVAAKDDPCRPTWGTAYTLDEAADQLDLDRRLAQLRSSGGSAMVSFGGQLNDDLAVGCVDQDALVAAYSEVVERYGVRSVDMDIEGTFLADNSAVQRQADAVADLQAEARGRGDGLDVWLTLPVSLQGLTPDGARAVRAYLDSGVDLAGINAMTMNYNSDLGADVNMADAAEGSLSNLHAQLRSIYNDAELPLGDATVWSKISATPMIGQNEIRGEVFTLDDAVQLNAFANDRGMVRLSMWSLNRDRTCAENWPDTQRVSDSCSGVDQGASRFMSLLSEGRTGKILHDPVETDSKLVDAKDIIDDPDRSPYPIWDNDAAYAKNTKIVWRKNVYESNWWTQGDRPDDPLVAVGANPWRLLGPVLPGEKPIPRPGIPEGALPNWSKSAVYERDSQVMFDGTGFVAKWWTQGDSPDAAFVVPDSSPWRVLTDDEILILVSDSDQ